MTEDNLEDRSEKDIKDLDLQIEMVLGRNQKIDMNGEEVEDHCN